MCGRSRSTQDLPLEEAFDFGKHHPCWVARQVDPFGALCFVGGVQGEDLFLDDFMRVVMRYREEWFPGVKELKTCCDPAGSQANQGQRQTGVEILRAHYPPRHRIAMAEHSNAPDVRLTMIEELAKAMRQRTSTGEAFGIDDRRWLRVSSRRQVEPWPFLADAMESGWVWSDHFVSVNHKPMRQPLADGWYDHSMVCATYLQLNFSPRRTPAQAEPAAPRRAARARADRVDGVSDGKVMAPLGSGDRARHDGYGGGAFRKVG